MQALILAGGLGTRLYPVVNNVPKPLAPIRATPFLDILLGELHRQHITNVVLAVGYKHQQIQNHYPLLKYSIEPKPLGTAGAIKHAAPLLDNRFLVVNGDTYFSLPYAKLFSFHEEHKADLTLTLCHPFTSTGCGYVTLNPSSQITSFQETQGPIPNNGFINAGVYCLEKSFLSLIPSGKCSLENTIFPQALSTHRLYGLVFPGQFIDIGTPNRYALAQKVL